jgi:hypothetical protein
VANILDLARTPLGVLWNVGQRAIASRRADQDVLQELHREVTHLEHDATELEHLLRAECERPPGRHSSAPLIPLRSRITEITAKRYPPALRDDARLRIDLDVIERAAQRLDASLEERQRAIARPATVTFDDGGSIPALTWIDMAAWEHASAIRGHSDSAAEGLRAHFTRRPAHWGAGTDRSPVR